MSNEFIKIDVWENTDYRDNEVPDDEYVFRLDKHSAADQRALGEEIARLLFGMNRPKVASINIMHIKDLLSEKEKAEAQQLGDVPKGDDVPLAKNGVELTLVDTCCAEDIDKFGPGTTHEGTDHKCIKCKRRLIIKKDGRGKFWGYDHRKKGKNDNWESSFAKEDISLVNMHYHKCCLDTINKSKRKEFKVGDYLYCAKNTAKHKMIVKKNQFGDVLWTHDYDLLYPPGQHSNTSYTNEDLNPSTPPIVAKKEEKK